MPADILQINSDIGTFKVGFLLLDKFTLMPLSSATEPLRMANHLTGKRLYDWRLIGESAEPVSTSGGIRLLPDTTIDEAPDFDLVIVVAGINVKENTHPKTVKWLSSIARKTPLMGGICTAPLVLAQAGLSTVIPAALIGSVSPPFRRSTPSSTATITCLPLIEAG